MLAFKGSFQDLVSLIRPPESLNFNHGSYLPQHGLSVTRLFHIRLLWHIFNMIL